MDQMRHYQSQSAKHTLTQTLWVYLKSPNTSSPASSTLEIRAHGFTKLWCTQKGENTWSLFCHQSDCCNISVAVRYLIVWLMKPYLQKNKKKKSIPDSLNRTPSPN